jgi:SAM-dependent methyltransferase
MGARAGILPGPGSEKRVADLRRYTREYLQQYEGESFELHLIAARKAKVLDSLRRYRHDRILEVGCGADPFFRGLEDYSDYVVVEPAGEFLQQARSYARHDARIRFLQGYLEDVAERGQLGAEFDFIIVSSLLHEVSDPARLLQAVRRLCTASTVVHLNVPNVYSFHRLLALEMGLIRSLFEPSETEVRFQRQTRFDRAALLHLLEHNGFRALRFETYVIKPFANAQMERLLREGVIDVRTIDALGRMVKHLPDMGCEMLVDMVVDEMDAGEPR